MSDPNVTARSNTAFARSGLTGLRTWVSLSMLTAVTYVVMYLSKMLPQVYGFLQLEVKSTVVCIGGFVFGPLAAAVIAIVTAVIEMITVSDTGPIGCIMNCVAACAFACPAAFVYQKMRTKKGAVAGLTLGVITATAVMLLWNFLLVPLYTPTISREAVVAALPTVFLPFNLVKCGLNMALTLVLYKPVVTALRKARLVPESRGESQDSGRIGFLLFSLALLATFGGISLALMKII